MDNLVDRWADRVARGRSPMGDDFLSGLVRASPLFAAHLLLQGPPDPPFYGRFLYGDVHLDWDRILTGEDRTALIAPRTVGKSFFFGVFYGIWRGMCEPTQNGLLLGSTAENAQEVLEKARQQIEENPLLHFLLPKDKKTRQWNKRRITMANGHSIRARSVLSRIRGLHPHWVVCDDILSEEAKISEDYRNKTYKFFFSVIEPMVMPRGRILVVGTPMHQDDLYAKLGENPGYQSYRFPILNAEGRSLWPEVFPEAYIAGRREIMGSVQFTCEMMCEAISDDTSLLPRSLFVGAPQEQPTFRLGMPQAELAALGLKFYMGVDLAFSAASGADYFVAMVLGLDDHGNRWIVDIDRARGLDYLAQPSRILAMGRRYRCQRIYVEANAAQRIIGDQLIRETDLPIKKWHTTAKKHDTAYGIPALRILAENRKFRIPRGDAHSVELTNLLLDEMAAFTFQKGKVRSLAAHDDLVLALYIADQAARVGAGFFSGAGPSTRGLPPGAAPGTNVAPPHPIRPSWRR